MVHRAMLLSSLWELPACLAHSVGGTFSSEMENESVDEVQVFPCLQNLLPNGIHKLADLSIRPANPANGAQVREEITWVQQKIFLYPELESLWVFLRFLNVAMFAVSQQGNFDTVFCCGPS